MEQQRQHRHQKHYKKEKFKCHIAYDLDIIFFNFNCCGSCICCCSRWMIYRVENEVSPRTKWAKKLETEESNFRSIAFIAHLSSNGKFLSDSIPSEFCVRWHSQQKDSDCRSHTHTRAHADYFLVNFLHFIMIWLCARACACACVWMCGCAHVF